MSGTMHGALSCAVGDTLSIYSMSDAEWILDRSVNMANLFVAMRSPYLHWVADVLICDYVQAFF